MAIMVGAGCWGCCLFQGKRKTRAGRCRGGSVVHGGYAGVLVVSAVRDRDPDYQAEGHCSKKHGNPVRGKDRTGESNYCDPSKAFDVGVWIHGFVVIFMV